MGPSSQGSRLSLLDTDRHCKKIALRHAFTTSDAHGLASDMNTSLHAIHDALHVAFKSVQIRACPMAMQAGSHRSKAGPKVVWEPRTCMNHFLSICQNDNPAQEPLCLPCENRPKSMGS
jgi:hypothetical protein